MISILRIKSVGFLVLFKLFCITSFLESCESQCVVFVSNQKYFPRFLESLEQLVTKGNYHGDICLVIGDDLLSNKLLRHRLLIRNHVIIKHFPDLPFSQVFLEFAKQAPHPFNEKLFQYHKLYLFDTYFKQWDTIFYIDSGMKIYRDIQPILNAKKQNKLLAHSDAYPSYEWKLGIQFNANFPEIFSELSRTYNLDIDYFQTTTMLYDTNIIQKDTFQNLYNLTLRYPISRTNDQGIIALYFTNIVSVWEQLPIRNEETFFYDLIRRGREKESFIMIKYDF
ncbi:MAG: hypothetical protein WCG10_02770 [Chlamydiota bacterium]